MKKTQLIAALATIAWIGSAQGQASTTNYRPGLLELAPENPSNSLFSDQTQEGAGSQVRCSNNSVNVCVSRKVIIDPSGRVPEPGTLALLGVAVIALATATRQRRRRS